MSASPLEVLLRDERALRRELRRREAARAKAEAEAVARLTVGAPCPVCQQALAAEAGPPLPPALLRRPPLACPGCGLALPWQPTAAGHALGRVLGGGLAVVGLMTVLSAQQLTDGSARTTSFAVGAAVLAVGAAAWQTIDAFAEPAQLAGRVEARRREREAGRPLPGTSRLGENLRELVFAAILYLVLRHVAVEAFVIPTGSMAPTLYGNNIGQTCRRCAFPFRQGKGEFEALTGREVPACCPVCGEVFATYPTESIDGNKILVDKLIYRLRAPRRWEVVVFKWPEGPGKSFIKRLVGLPGETLRVLGGDVFADGALQRKPDEVQDAIWVPFLDARYAFAGDTPAEGAGALFWRPAEGTPAGAWDVARDGRRLVARPGGGAAWLECQRDVRAYTSYNDRGGEVRVPHLVSPTGDVRVRAVVTPAEGARAVRLAIHDGDRPVVATFPVGAPGRFTVEAGGKVIAADDARAPLAPGRAVEVGLAYHDDRARLQVDGRTVAAADDAEATPSLDDADAPRRLQERRVVVRLGAEGGEAAFEDVRLDRDIHYVVGGRVSLDPAVAPVKVPAGAFFCMGDNGPSSSDSRYWGFVREGHLQGRAFFVWWPLRPFEPRRVR